MCHTPHMRTCEATYHLHSFGSFDGLREALSSLLGKRLGNALDALLLMWRTCSGALVQRGRRPSERQHNFLTPPSVMLQAIHKPICTAALPGRTPARTGRSSSRASC
jgi:hypothetical protein